MVVAVGWPLLWADWLDTDAKLESKIQVRKLEEELRVEKDVWLPTTLLALGQSQKVEEQDNKLETVVCHFAKLGRHKLDESLSASDRT